LAFNNNACYYGIFYIGICYLGVHLTFYRRW
jgi:hypothetical protein